MRGLFALIAAAVIGAPALAMAQTAVVSERPDAVAVTVYPAFGGYGLAMISETRTVDLPAGPVRLSFRGVADQMLAQTVAVQGLPQAVAEQNFDFQLLTPMSLLHVSEGRQVTLVRTNPANGLVTAERARVLSSELGGVLDIGGRVEALRCAGAPERLVFDDLPAGFVARPTLSVDFVSPSARRARLTLSYLATGVEWKANYIARLRPDEAVMDLTSWITITNDSDTTFANAPTQVIAGRLERVWETTEPEPPPAPPPPPFASIRMGANGCWPINSGRHSSRVLLTFNGHRMADDPNTNGSGINVTGGAMQNANNIPMEMLQQVEIVSGDLGDYKIYSLPQPTTLAARQTKQLFMFQRQAVEFRPVYRREMSSLGGKAGDSFEARPIALVLMLRNEKDKGLGLPMPSGNVIVLEPGAGGVPLVRGQPNVRDVAVDTPFELDLDPAASVQSRHTIVSRTRTPRAETVEVEAQFTNTSSRTVEVEWRDAAQQSRPHVKRATHRHTIAQGALQWTVPVPAGETTTLRYTLSWRR